MTVYELIEKMDGYILNNKARVMHNGENVVVGVFVGEELVFTEIGNELAAAQSNMPAKAPRKKAVVETPVETEQPAVESQQAAPEAAPQE
jgi:hypothetical protein